MGQKGKPVIKYDLDGNETHRYQDANEAAEAEGLTKAGLYNKIATGAKGKGCSFQFGDRPKAHDLRDRRKTAPPPEHPWEKNGLFCSNGWSQACIY